MDAMRLAYQNLDVMSKKTYPGRMVIAGLSPSGKIVLVTVTEGRGDDSRNRVYRQDTDGRVYTKAADPSKIKDPSQAQYIFYDAMMDFDGGWHAASNGHQTKAVRDNDDLRIAMHVHGFRYESDSSSTPRITALCHRGASQPSLEMCIFKRSVFDESCNYFSFIYPTMFKGLGHCLTTYVDNGNPLPSFCGEPILLPILGDTAEEISEDFWKILDEDNRVSIAAKTVDQDSGDVNISIINKYTEVEVAT